MHTVFETNHVPFAGKYKNTILVDGTNNKVYIYDCDGVWTLIESAALDTDNQTLTVNGTELTITDGNTVDLEALVQAAETITTFVDNGDGTATYTSEDGTVTTITITGVAEDLCAIPTDLACLGLPINAPVPIVTPDLTVTDTESIDLTLTLGGDLSADVLLNPLGGLETTPSGLAVNTDPNGGLQNTISGLALSIDPAVCNTLTTSATGLLAPAEHTSIAGNFTYADYTFTALNDFTRKTVVITNPSSCRSMVVKFDSTWNMGIVVARTSQSGLVAQRFRVNGAINAGLTSVTLAGLTGGYDVTYANANTTFISNGHDDSSFGSTHYTHTLAPGASVTIDLDIALVQTNDGTTLPSDFSAQSINVGYIGVTV